MIFLGFYNISQGSQADKIQLATTQKTIREAAASPQRLLRHKKTIREAAASPRRLLRHKKRSVRLLHCRRGCYDTKNDPWGCCIAAEAATTQKNDQWGCYDTKNGPWRPELSPPHVRLSNTAQRYRRLLQTWLQQEKSTGQCAGNKNRL